jgi:hypothetical protein
MIHYTEELGWHWLCKWCAVPQGLSGYYDKKAAHQGLQIHMAKEHRAN